MLKLELIRIISHETEHVLIRRAMSDMNESTPELIKLNYDQQQKDQESGILTELEHFGVKIDFQKTCELPSFNAFFFVKLLNDIIDGRAINIDGSNQVVVFQPADYDKMPLDMDIPKERFMDI